MCTNLTEEEQNQKFKVEVIFESYADAVDFWMAAQNPNAKAICGSIDYVNNINSEVEA